MDVNGSYLTVSNRLDSLLLLSRFGKIIWRDVCTFSLENYDTGIDLRH